MSKTLFCIRLSRTLIILLILIFITLSQMQIFHIKIIPWPTYHPIVAILLDMCLVIGLIATLTQHLKTLIFFSWLSALTFLLIFFGNTVSSQYQSDLIGMFYLLFICILAFTDAVCIIKYRMPSEEAHHPFVKIPQQPPQTGGPPFGPQPSLFPDQQQHHPHHHTLGASTSGMAADPSLVPLPPHYILHHHSPARPPPATLPLPPPPPPPHSSQTSQQQSFPSGGLPPTTGSVQTSSSLMAASPSSPLPPSLSLNSHCYVSKNDPQFHAV